MTQVAESLSEENPFSMSEAQRRCLLHVLRNSAAALEGLVFLLERRDSSPSPVELDGCVRGVERTLNQMRTRLQCGSFCALLPEQCNFVGPFVGCKSSASKKTE